MGKVRVPVARIWEKFYPVFFALLAAATAWHLDLVFEDTKVTNQLSSTINVSAILMGFLGTAKAMLLSFNSRQYQAIRANKYLWSMLLSYFSQAMLAALSLCIFSLVLFSVDPSKYKGWNVGPYWSIGPVHVSEALLPIWIGLSTFAFLAFFRILRVIFGLLKAS
ncbi:hypothetical protein [Cupriavidus basilensis]|uniref:hypothetical protein n=1 Tax=Cupriavidus basilensis TaxID=68895 RepID=UPI0039F680B0